MSPAKTFFQTIITASVAAIFAFPMVANGQPLEAGWRGSYAEIERLLKAEGHEIVASSKRFKPNDELISFHFSRNPNGSGGYILLTDNYLDPTRAKILFRLEGQVKIFNPTIGGKVAPENSLIRSRNESLIADQCVERLRARQFSENNCFNHNVALNDMAKSYMKPMIQGDAVVQFPNTKNPEPVRVTVLLRTSFGVGATDPNTPDGSIVITAGNGTATFMQGFYPHSGSLNEAGVRQVGR